MSELAEWDSFYLIVGAAAGALIGLQFVVMTLIEGRPERPSPEAGAAFATPTIVHFGTALLLSALLRAPWHSVGPLAILLGLMGCLGTLYASKVVCLIRAQTMYVPDRHDWLCYAILPWVGYATLLLSSFFLPGALFAVGGSALLLLFVGIHNAWDGVSYHVFNKREPVA